MNGIKKVLLIAAMACVGMSLAQAQNNNSNSDNSNNNNNNGGRRRFGGDPSQFRQMMMDRLKERLEVKDDTEWKALEPLIQKVMDARRDVLGMSMGGFGRRGGGGDNGGDNGPRRGGGFFGGTPSQEMEALDRAVEAKASKSELKAAIAKVQDARKAKQADLEKAQDNLRKVLTTRQEAIATANGLL